VADAHGSARNHGSRLRAGADGKHRLPGGARLQVSRSGDPRPEEPARTSEIHELSATGAGGNLFIPVDTTYMGAGVGPDGTTPYLQNRATLHLHGGATPWISDGTPHQWTIPYGESSLYDRGVSTAFVPDMFFDSTGKMTPLPQCVNGVATSCWPTAVPAGLSNDPGVGSMTFYWSNQQGGRLMFYHDHAYGITRLNVYVGEAAGYLLADPTEEDALQKATVPGTLGAAVGGTTAPDLAHVIPLVFQDKTFVPRAGQLAGQDPTWIWGTGTAVPAGGANGNGDLWFPHVYTPNQNPADPGGANAFGRWDYGAWFFPPQTTLTAAGPGGPNNDPQGGVTISCTSAAFPGVVLQPSVANTSGRRKLHDQRYVPSDAHGCSLGNGHGSEQRFQRQSGRGADRNRNLTEGVWQRRCLTCLRARVLFTRKSWAASSFFVRRDQLELKLRYQVRIRLSHTPSYLSSAF
jgi:hypothetical protein